MATANPLSLLGFGKKQPAPRSTPAKVEHDTPGALEEPPALFSVVKGNPTEEELAALASVIVVAQQQANAHKETALELWQRRLNNTQRLGVKLRPGPGSWRRARPQ